MSGGESKSELVTLAREINRVHSEIVENAQAQLQRAIECGVMLKDAQDNVKHGDWDDWLAKNCPEIPDRTARLYLRLAKREKELEKLAAENGNTVADLSIRGALRLLAPVKSDEEKAKAHRLGGGARSWGRPFFISLCPNFLFQTKGREGHNRRWIPAQIRLTH